MPEEISGITELSSQEQAQAGLAVESAPSLSVADGTAATWQRPRQFLYGPGVGVVALGVALALAAALLRIPHVPSLSLIRVVSWAKRVWKPAGEPRIIRLDPRFDELVPHGALLEKIADGYRLAEGPVWSHRGHYLLFSDIPANRIYKWQENEGVTVFLDRSGYTGANRFPGEQPGSNGLAFDARGRLLLTAQGDRSIVALEASGHRHTLVDRYRGKRLNSPNDLVLAGNGDIYFTDPPYGLPDFVESGTKELPFNGVFRLRSDGKLDLISDKINLPNGIAISPDGRTMYVSNSDPRRPVWLAFDLRSDGTITNERLFFDGTGWKKGRHGAPDGIKVDQHGNLFAAGPGGIYVLAPDTTLLGLIDIGSVTTNLAWGNDGSVLYVTTKHSLYRIRLTTKGLSW